MQPCQDLNDRLENEYQASKHEINDIVNMAVEQQWTVHQLLDHMFPEATLKEKNYYLVEKTGYPFALYPRPGETDLHALVESLWTARQLQSRGQARCFCGKVIMINQECECRLLQQGVKT